MQKKRMHCLRLIRLRIKKFLMGEDFYAGQRIFSMKTSLRVRKDWLEDSAGADFCHQSLRIGIYWISAWGLRSCCADAKIASSPCLDPLMIANGCSRGSCRPSVHACSLTLRRGGHLWPPPALSFEHQGSSYEDDAIFASAT